MKDSGLVEEPPLAIKASPTVISFRLFYEGLRILGIAYFSLQVHNWWTRIVCAYVIVLWLQSIAQLIRAWMQRPTLILMDEKYLTAMQMGRRPIAWSALEGCTYRAILWSKTLQISDGRQAFHINLSLTSRARAKLAFDACRRRISQARPELARLDADIKQRDESPAVSALVNFMTKALAIAAGVLVALPMAELIVWIQKHA